MSLGRSFAAASRADTSEHFTKICVTNAMVVLQCMNALVAASDSRCVHHELLI